MALVFETVQTEGIAELSYLIGDDAEGVAAVFDPKPDVDCYIQMARQKKLSITHIFETHIHADLVSGARELCARVKSAKIFLSKEGDARYGFEHEQIKNGDTFTLGSVLIKVQHTPGHTPEHVAFLLAEEKHPKSPWGVLTGDSLFVNSAGRPDLLGSGQSKKLAEQQFHTLRHFYLTLDDGVVIYPAHGHGSPCGADIGDRLISTIGHEKRFNPFLQYQDVESFTQYALSTAPPVPTYYPRMKKVNARGPEVLGNLPGVPGLPAEFFSQAAKDGHNVVIDTRTMLAFGGGHVPQALNIGASPMLSIWAGWLLDPQKPILLILDSDEKINEVICLFLRTGYTKFAGYLVGGMKAWDNAGLPLEEVGQMGVHEVKREAKKLQILDVRAPDEWKNGHIPHARHIFLGELREKAAGLDKRKRTAVYCDSGYRASIATSILKQNGFKDVYNIPGSWQAWQKAGYPVEGAGPGEARNDSS